MTENRKWFDEHRNVVITTVGLAITVFVIAGGVYLTDQSGENTAEDSPGDGSGLNTFTNENYGLSFSYPSSWSLDNYKYSGVLIVTISENSTSGGPSAQAQIYAGSLGYPSLDNMEDQITESAENNENMSIVGEIERITVDGDPGIDFSYTSSGENYDVKGRTRFLRKENFEYSISYSSLEDSYEEFQADLDSIIESFSLI